MEEKSVLGNLETTIDDPELCDAFIKFLKKIVSLGKSITPTFTNIEGKKESHNLIVYKNTLYIGSDKSLSTNFINITYDNIMRKYNRLIEQLEEHCPEGITLKFSSNDINAWIKEYGERVKTIHIYENGINLVVYPKRIEKLLRISIDDMNYIADINTKLEERFDFDSPLAVIEMEELYSEQLNIYDIPSNKPLIIGFNLEDGTHCINTGSIDTTKYPLFFRLFKSVFLKNVKTKDAEANMYLYEDRAYPGAYILLYLIENKKYEGYQFFRVH